MEIILIIHFTNTNYILFIRAIKKSTPNEISIVVEFADIIRFHFIAYVYYCINTLF